MRTEYAIVGNRYDSVTRMENNEEYNRELERLHQKLARIYRLGALTPAERIETQGLWARIERLMVAQVAVQVRETKRIAAADTKELQVALTKLVHINKEKS